MAAGRRCPRLAERQFHGQVRGAVAGHERHVHLVGGWNLAGCNEVVERFVRGDRLRAFIVGDSEMKVAPVNAKVVAGPAQNVLVA